jgi:methylenetetrahydrofolate reductase (NADPH)
MIAPKSLSELYRSRGRVVSIELFPPKSSAGEESLYEHVDRLMAHRPDFITCTYGAGGSTRQKTLEIVCAVKSRFGCPVASHLTVVGSTAGELREYLKRAHDEGVDFIVALRGDPPRGESAFRPVPGGFRHARELVALIRDEFPRFGVAVAGYPEKHQEAVSVESDIEFLRQKVAAGADVVLTQLFFDNRDFFRFRQKCHDAGISVPIVPGILPVTNLKQIQRIATLCGAQVPQPFAAELARRDSAEWQLQVGVDYAIGQVHQLLDAGVPGLHFYVLNQSQAMMAILDSLTSRAPRPD